MRDIYGNYDTDKTGRQQAIFASIFYLQNKLQTVGEKLMDKLSIKQWLLLCMVDACPKSKTLTNVGELMGCSRQNVKQLAVALENKGFLKLMKGANNAIVLDITKSARSYLDDVSDVQVKAVKTLFSELDKKEIKQLYYLVEKLLEGMEKLESKTGASADVDDDD